MDAAEVERNLATYDDAEAADRLGRELDPERVEARTAVASVRALPLDDATFDAVWTMSTLMHVPSTAIDGALTEVRRVLAPGGRLAAGVWGGSDVEDHLDNGRFGPPRLFSRRADDTWRHLLSEHVGDVEEFGRGGRETRSSGTSSPSCVADRLADAGPGRVRSRNDGMEPTNALHRALDQTSAIVAAIDPQHLVRPTPCADFDVKALLNHTVASMQGLADAASGEPWDMTTYGRDLLGDDPRRAFAESAEQLRAATPSGAGSDTLERNWNMPFGETPGAKAIAVAIMEVTQHGWDVAKATGQQPAYDEELAEAALALAHENMPPDDQRTPQSFGPAVPVPDDAPAHDRLAAFMGRTL